MLNDIEIAIVSTRAMRFSQKEVITYLKSIGFDISLSVYYRHLALISSQTRQRAFEIAKSFLEDHINTIDELYNIKKMMYVEFVKEDDPLKKTMILAKITETMIPYISAYREATKQIIEEVKKKVDSKEKDFNLSALGI